MAKPDSQNPPPRAAPGGAAPAFARSRSAATATTSTTPTTRSERSSSSRHAGRDRLTSTIIVWREDQLRQGRKEHELYIEFGGDFAQWVERARDTNQSCPLPVTPVNVQLAKATCRNPELIGLYLFIMFGTPPHLLLP